MGPTLSGLAGSYAQAMFPPAVAKWTANLQLHYTRHQYGILEWGAGIGITDRGYLEREWDDYTQVDVRRRILCLDTRLEAGIARPVGSFRPFMDLGLGYGRVMSDDLSGTAYSRDPRVSKSLDLGSVDLMNQPGYDETFERNLYAFILSLGFQCPLDRFWNIGLKLDYAAGLTDFYKPSDLAAHLMNININLTLAHSFSLNRKE